MTLAFRRPTVMIPNGLGRKTITGVATFNSPVLNAAVALNGFKLEYDNADEQILVVEADTDFVSIVGNDVNYQVQCNLRDDSATETYSGYINLLVIADVS